MNNKEGNRKLHAFFHKLALCRMCRPQGICEESTGQDRNLKQSRCEMPFAEQESDAIQRGKMTEMLSEITSLRTQLCSANQTIYELKHQTQVYCDQFATLLSQPDEKLSRSSYDVLQKEDGTSWEVVTAHCILGGCDMDIYSFPTERDARIFALLLDVVGYQPPRNTACPRCYGEYVKECI